MQFFRRLFCKHDYEIVRKVEMFASISGEQLEYEGGGYK